MKLRASSASLAVIVSIGPSGLMADKTQRPSGRNFCRNARACQFSFCFPAPFAPFDGPPSRGECRLILTGAKIDGGAGGTLEDSAVSIWSVPLFALGPPTACGLGKSGIHKGNL